MSARLSVHFFIFESAHRISLVFGILNLYCKFTKEFNFGVYLFRFIKLYFFFVQVSQIILIFLETPRPRVCTHRKVAADIMQLYNIYEKYLDVGNIY
jgi:hypothetical protein